MAVGRKASKKHLEVVELVNRSGDTLVVLEDGTEHALIVDMGYQRVLNRRKVEDIRSEFDEDACGALVLSLRRNGDAAIVDGQHLIQAMVLEGVTEAFADIYEGITVARESRIRRIQNDRRPDTSLEKFKADLAAEGTKGGPITELVALLARHGTKINSSPTMSSGINCPSTIQNLYERDDGPRLLDETFSVLTSAFSKLGGKVVSASMIDGLAWFLVGHHGEYSRRKLVQQMASAGADEIADISRGFKRAMGGADWVNHYRALVEVYNRGVRKVDAKLEMKTARWGAAAGFGRSGQGWGQR